MGAIIPQVVTSDRASGAQVIDGSLHFDENKQYYLERTATDSGSDIYKMTVSWWMKLTKVSGDRFVFNFGSENDLTGWTRFSVQNAGNLNVQGVVGNVRTTALYRDTGWYHYLVSVDTTQSAYNDQVKMYVNGVEIDDWNTTTAFTQNTALSIGENTKHYIGVEVNSTGTLRNWLTGTLSQVYVIENQILDASYFGYTDGLTNTWKPKKYEGTFGTNGFYLPMDGNSPIGQDQSGQGNNFTPKNFGGSVSLDNPIVSGARPILNTTQGGAQAGVGVFGSKQNVGYAVTVYDDGGGNKYYIDGVKQATLTGLIRGATYTFDTSDSTVGSTHPFRFAASDGGSQYSNGVAAITGTATTITIPYNAPNELYYYCTSHSGMGSSITGITTNEKLADQYASHCTLALPLVGADDDVCASIACTANNKTPTNSSVTASNTESNFYNGSHHWSANSDTLQYAEQGDELVFGTGDFTIECWVYDDDGHNGSGGRCYIFDNRIGGSVVGDPPQVAAWVDGSNEFNFNYSANTISVTVPTTVGKWWHFAATREGTTIRFFLDGILRGSATNSTSFPNNGMGVGRATDGGYGWAGYIQDFRVYRGVAKYTSNFVPPATSPDILPDTPSGVSGGSKLAKADGGSTTFGKRTSKLTNSGDFAGISGTGDYTLSFWFYANEFSSLDNNGGDGGFLYIFDQGASHPTYAITVNISKAGKVIVVDSANFGPTWLSTFDYAGDYNTDHNVVLGKWNYIHVYRSSGTLYIYNNGGLQLSKSQSSSSPSPYKLDICSNTDNVILKDLRVTNTAITDATPPESPLTAVSGTQLLICHGNGLTDISGNSNTLSTTGTVTDSNFNPFTNDINTVRGQESGYATLNPIRAAHTYSNGNLDWTFSTTGNTSIQPAMSTLVMESGKWFWETTIQSGATGIFVGIWNVDNFTNDHPGSTSDSYAYWSNNGNKYNNDSNSSYGSAFTTVGTVVGTAYDADNGTIEFFKNGVSQGVAYSGITQRRYVAAYHKGTTGTDVRSAEANFGQKPFKFLPPDGFQPLNTANTRPVKVISRPDQYVGISTWTGDSAASRNIDIGIKKPDLVWLKNRFVDGRSNYLYDSVRGFGANKEIVSNASVEEGSSGHVTQNHGYVSGNTINGFTLAEGATNSNYTNQSGQSYVAWAWKAGGNKNTFNVDDVGYASAAAAGLTAGSITPTGASVGTKQGFSIIKWTAPDPQDNTATVPHGLTQKPDFWAVKSLDGSRDWICYTEQVDGSLDFAHFNNAEVFANSSATAPTATTFGVYGNDINTAGEDQIAYLWHDVPGLQKFGTYTSGGSTYDGPYIELGFKPAIVMVKAATRTFGSNWSVIDAERNKGNFSSSGSGTKISYWSTNTVEFTSGGAQLDILSNGFKVRNNSSDINDGGTYIYAAWAEAPSVDLYGGGANAH